MAPGKSAFLVTGDPSRNKVLTVPGGGFAIVRIELPAAWDALMAERGYAPLSSFRVAPRAVPGRSRDAPGQSSAGTATPSRIAVLRKSTALRPAAVLVECAA